MGNPTYISFYRGVAENEGKMIIAPAQEEDGKIRIGPDRKRVFFWNSDFVSMCGKYMQKYSGGTFKRGSFFSIHGERIEDSDAFVFDFREAVEHIVKCPGRDGKIKQMHPQPFSMPRGYQAMM